MSGLKKVIEKMSEDEERIKQPDKIVNIVEKIFDFNKHNQDGQG